MTLARKGTQAHGWHGQQGPRSGLKSGQVWGGLEPVPGIAAVWEGLSLTSTCPPSLSAVLALPAWP